MAYRNGAPVKLSDVARATEGAENTKLAAWMNTDEAVIVNIQRQPGANVIEVVDRIQALLPQLRAALPSAVDVAVLTDRTTTIRASVADVEFELGLAVVLVVIVIFVFLRSPSATLIPSLSVPLSLVGTLAVMYLAGFSLNNLSLMALTIATGFVVDDAIVMIENISRYIEAGDPPLQAALKGSEQIGFTIISLTVSLIAVLIPLLFMPDVVGRLFREFAITLAVTIVISAVVALTLVPMMCAKILRHRRPSEMSLVARKSQQWFDALIAQYGRLLNLGARPPAADFAGGSRHPRPHRVSLHRDPEGLFPGPGHRAHPGDLRGRAFGLLRGHGATPAGAGRRHPQGPRCREPVFLYRRRRHQFDPQYRPVSDQSEAARAAQYFGQRRDPAAGAGDARRLPASRSICSRSRI